MKNFNQHTFNKIFSITLLGITCFSVRSFAQSSAWAVPESAKHVKNPYAGNQGGLVDGKMLYGTYCTPCHGTKGKGDGAAAAALNPKPADHSSSTVQAQTDGAIFWKLTTGRGSMASYKATLTDKQRWELVGYMRTLAKR